MNIELDKAYTYYIYASYILYISVLIGVFSTVPEYVNVINSFVKVSIACVLLYKFNPFQKNYVLTKFDKQIVFSSGIFLLLTTFVGEYLVSYESKIKMKFNQIIGK